MGAGQRQEAGQRRRMAEVGVCGHRAHNVVAHDHLLLQRVLGHRAAVGQVEHAALASGGITGLPTLHLRMLAEHTTVTVVAGRQPACIDLVCDGPHRRVHPAVPVERVAVLPRLRALQRPPAVHRVQPRHALLLGEGVEVVPRDGQQQPATGLLEVIVGEHSARVVIQRCQRFLGQVLAPCLASGHATEATHGHQRLVPRATHELGEHGLHREEELALGSAHVVHRHQHSDVLVLRRRLQHVGVENEVCQRTLRNRRAHDAQRVSNHAAHFRCDRQRVGGHHVRHRLHELWAATRLTGQAHSTLAAGAAACVVAVLAGVEGEATRLRAVVENGVAQACQQVLQRHVVIRVGLRHVADKLAFPSVRLAVAGREQPALHQHNRGWGAALVGTGGALSGGRIGCKHRRDEFGLFLRRGIGDVLSKRGRRLHMHPRCRGGSRVRGVLTGKQAAAHNLVISHLAHRRQAHDAGDVTLRRVRARQLVVALQVAWVVMVTCGRIEGQAHAGDHTCDTIHVHLHSLGHLQFAGRATGVGEANKMVGRRVFDHHVGGACQGSGVLGGRRCVQQPSQRLAADVAGPTHKVLGMVHAGFVAFQCGVLHGAGRAAGSKTAMLSVRRKGGVERRGHALLEVQGGNILVGRVVHRQHLSVRGLYNVEGLVISVGQPLMRWVRHESRFPRCPGIA